MEFITFLEQLSEKFGGKDFSIFMDNLMVHKSRSVKETYERLNITPIYNIPYSPDFNGIESYFSMVKREYKSLLLQVLMKDEKVEAKPLIVEAVSVIDNEKVKRCVLNGLKCIGK